MIATKTYSQHSIQSPFGMVMPGRNWQAGSAEGYGFGFNGKLKEDKIIGNNITYDFGARIYNSTLGRWFGPDNLTKKYPSLSPYIFSADCPILFVDFDGNDWFINQTTGDVIFIKNTSAINQEVINKLHIDHIDPTKFVTLGPDKMFGDKFEVFEGMDILKDDFSEFDLNNNIDVKVFEKYGYYYAEEVIIKEKQYVSSGPMDGGERVTTTLGTIEQLGSVKKDLVKKDELNQKQIIEENVSSDKWSQISTTKYKLTKPAGQDNRRTAIYRENQQGNLDKSIKLNISLLKFVVEQIF